MSKFEEILAQYSDIIEEMPVVTPDLDLTALDQATGEQIRDGLAEFMGNNEDQMSQVLQGLVNSKSINPNAQVAAPAQTQQAATTKVASQTSAPQPNPAASAETRAVGQITP